MERGGRGVFAPGRVGGDTEDGVQTLSSSLLACDASNVVVETIKRAEDGEGLIVRLYESQRRRGEVTLTTAFPLAAVHRSNLLEENQAELTLEGNRVTLFVKPHEIVTLRLV